MQRLRLRLSALIREDFLSFKWFCERFFDVFMLWIFHSTEATHAEGQISYTGCDLPSEKFFTDRKRSALPAEMHVWEVEKAAARS